MNQQKFYTRVLKIELETDELDVQLQEYLNFDNENYFNIIRKEEIEHIWEPDGEPIEIKKFIKTLQEMQKNGCTHIEMQPQINYYSYAFHGVEYRDSTEDEIKAHQFAVHQIKEKEKKLAALVEEYKKIVNEE